LVEWLPTGLPFDIDLENKVNEVAWPVERAAKIQRATRALRGRLHPALPVEGATQAP